MKEQEKDKERCLLPDSVLLIVIFLITAVLCMCSNGRFTKKIP